MSHREDNITNVFGPTALQAREGDREMAREALEKRQAGGKPNRRETAALKRVQHDQQMVYVAEYMAAMPKSHYSHITGRARNVLLEQAARYNLPLGDTTINVPSLLKGLHEFLAANKYKYLGDKTDPDMAGENSPALERFRLARAKREEFAYERDLGEWVRVEGVHDGLSRLAAILRQCGDILQRTFGADAYAVLEEALAEFDREVSTCFNTPSDGKDSTGGPSGASK